jgi:hypothetical protein
MIQFRTGWVLLFWAIAGNVVAIDVAIDFERDVAPILESLCLSCHEGNDAKGGVRLDLADDVLELLAPGDANHTSG